MMSIGTSNIEKEMDLKKEKSNSKSSFTLYRNRLLLLIEVQGLPRPEVSSALQENGLVYGIVDRGNVSVVRYLHTK